MTIGLAVTLLAACSGPKSTRGVSGPAADASGVASDTGRRAGTGGGASTGGAGGSGTATGAGAELDAAAGVTDVGPDAPSGGVDGGANDLRPTRDATPLPDGPYRYPDPAGPLCGDTRHTLARTTAQVTLVLDRSSSMTDPIIPPTSKWDDAKAAVEGAMAANPQIAWGLKLFPTGTPEVDSEGKECDVSATVEVPPGFGTPAAIAAAMDRSAPNELSGTPTDRAVTVAASSLKASKLALPRYILLVTDGIPNCPGDEVGLDNTLKALEAAAAAGLPTFVIGIWDSNIDSIAMLDRMAVAGGRPRAGMRKYYAANNRGQLDASLAAITQAITNCVFPLAVPPPDANFVGVTVDGQLIPRDPTHAEGWDYLGSGKGVEIFGSACSELKNGTAQSVGVHYGCPK
jgi:hypothetical protein